MQQGRSTSFEDLPAGLIKSIRTDLGTWTHEQGESIIDNKHAKSGSQCLQIKGGAESSIILKLKRSRVPAGHLTFWAERWTSRAPFSFRIQADHGDGWKEIYNGDKQIRVGRAFLTRVKIPLEFKGLKRLRLSCKSPEGTGILIDDFSMAPLKPQKILGVEAIPVTLPALVGKESSALVKLKVQTEGELNPISLTGLVATFDAPTDPTDLEALQILHAPAAQGAIHSGKIVASKAIGANADRPQKFSLKKEDCTLVAGTNHLWLATQLKSSANIDHQVGALIQSIRFSNGQEFDLQHPRSMQRMGVALRNGGDEGVHTYRIPGLATTNKGTLIGVYDIRHSSGGDLPGHIDVGMSRSTDGGRTWEPMKTIMNMGSDRKWRHDGIGDPAVLVDQGTGTIWVAAVWSHGNRGWNGSGPGLTPEETGQFMLTRSDDDGKTWSDPINITEQIKDPEWCFILQGPGNGITMKDGTIVFAAQYQDPPSNRRLPHSTIIYSKDHGDTWQVGTGAFPDTTEAQVVELEPGVLMLNCRYNRKPARVVMITRDMGETWRKHPTSETALIEPRACMASLIKIQYEGEDWLLFSNPNSLSGRNHITIKASPDGGLSWPQQHDLLLDENGSAGYSCLSLIDEHTVGILYEGSQAHMTFQRVPLIELLRGALRAQKPAPPTRGISAIAAFAHHGTTLARG